MRWTVSAAEHEQTYRGPDLGRELDRLATEVFRAEEGVSALNKNRAWVDREELQRDLHSEWYRGLRWIYPIVDRVLHHKPRYTGYRRMSRSMGKIEMMALPNVDEQTVLRIRLEDARLQRAHLQWVHRDIRALRLKRRIVAAVVALQIFAISLALCAYVGGALYFLGMMR